MMDYDPRGGTIVRSHNRAIKMGSVIAYMCDHMFVRLRTMEVQACRSVACFSVKSHDRATTVMGCMMIHYARVQHVRTCSYVLAAGDPQEKPLD
jgi:hypothetical protein